MQKLPAWLWRPPAFAAGLLLICAWLYLAGSRVYADKELKEDLRLLGEVKKKHAAIFGASHARGLLLDEAGFDGLNFFHNGQDMFELAYVARTVKQRAPLLDHAFIALSYFSFGLDNAAYVQRGVQTRIGRRVSLYAGFGRFSFIPGDASEFLKGRFWPLVTRDHYRSGFTRLPHSLPDLVPEDDAPTEDEELEDVAESRAAKAKKVSQATEQIASKKKWQRRPDAWYVSHARGRCRMYAGYLAVMRREHPRVAEDAQAVLLDLVRDLERAKVSVVLFTPPYHRAYSACFEAKDEQLTREAGAKIAKATHAKYFDFSRDPDFVDNTHYFMDSDHLNRVGRPEFSRRLAEKLRE